VQSNDDQIRILESAFVSHALIYALHKKTPQKSFFKAFPMVLQRPESAQIQF